MVDTERTIPLFVDSDYKNTRMLMDVDDNTGFPFDGNLGRDHSFRTQLDDIAKRHPEFAEHLGPFRSNSTGRTHQESDGDYSRFQNRDRPFGSSFEQFGFPFTGDPFNEVSEFASPDSYIQPESHSQASSQEHSQSQHQPFGQNLVPETQYSNNQENSLQASNNREGINTENKSKKPTQGPERGRKPQTIQQSNTVDLGQKQEPVNERNQRSMSAPPSENRPNQRFVSSINIPVQRDLDGTEMGGRNSQPQQYTSQPQGQFSASQSQKNKPMERVIPIHVEGRDEPVMPKNPTFTPQPPQSSQGYHQQHPTYQQPQPETIFGHRPSHFTQFINRDSPSRGFDATDDLLRQQQEYQKPQPNKQHQQQPTREIPGQAQSVAQQHAAPPQPAAPPQQPQKLTPIDQIQAIQKDVSELMGQVEKFSGQPRDKQYLYLDEMLTRNLLKLDNIDTQGQENIRSARKAAIKCIESCIGILESKAAANVAQQIEKTGNMEIEQTEERADAKEQPMETEVVESTSAAALPNAESKGSKHADETMDIVPKGIVNEMNKETGVPTPYNTNNTSEDKLEPSPSADQAVTSQPIEETIETISDNTKPGDKQEMREAELNKDKFNEEPKDKREKKKEKKKSEKK